MTEQQEKDFNEKKEREFKIVKAAAHQLYEHFDTVQIFVTRHDSVAGTGRTCYGEGNYYTRYGQVRHWLIGEDEASRKECWEP